MNRISNFNLESARHGFTRWEEKYIYGSNSYPETWNYLREDFKKLTGVDILELVRNWLNND